ncbi:Ubiquitin fusion degradation 1-like protein [Rhynchospora pubera]|uniref:Ubiquitin fusion degradation 1-like protein n=1 Tax=Rhynchospora pubera TaxID=906938 RepID=A0AAV8GDD1_9POAL|nr:Ubiquitin fusion degradation 1-like protein [Rhynchospora pubera]
MYYDGYGYHNTGFERTYRCYPSSFIDKPLLEAGDKTHLNVEYPMLFELSNVATSRTSHCGVLEFTAEEGMIYMPYWPIGYMMQNLLLQEGDMIMVKNVTLPKGTYVKLQPHTTDFLDISNPKAILEKTLRSFSCLTTGDSIMVAYNSKNYYIDIVETKPSSAVSIIETDCEVDFAPPLDYKEPQPTKCADPVDIAAHEDLPEEKSKFSAFAGTGRRLDGRPAKQQESVPLAIPSTVNHQAKSASATDSKSGTGSSAEASTSSSKTGRPGGKLVFGSNSSGASKETQKETTKEAKQDAPKKEEPKFEAFTGRKFSLKD